MISPEYAQRLARYKHWMNDKIDTASEQLGDAGHSASDLMLLQQFDLLAA